MAEGNAEGGGSFPFNLPALLVLLALASGAWLVSQKLTSTRPAASAGMEHDVIGEQTVVARLWEDPFKPLERVGGGDRSPETNFPSSILHRQIQNRLDQDDHQNLLILTVMIPGSFYSEDQESRIRSRFAVGSALGLLGYAPKDPEHLGSVTLSWPARDRIKNLATELNRQAKKNSSQTLAQMWPWRLDKTTSSDHNSSPSLDLRYEWYRPRDFYPHQTNATHADILVLWLNERYFEDAPLLRLSMLLAPILEAAQEKAPSVALIGPWSSSTLRAMLPDWKSEGNGEPVVPLKKDYPTLWPEIQQKLKKIDVYSATATAMDATLDKKTVPIMHPSETLSARYWWARRRSCSTPSKTLSPPMTSLPRKCSMSSSYVVSTSQPRPSTTTSC